MPKAVVAELQDRQCVHLAGRHPGEINQKLPFGNHLAEALFNAVAAVDFLFHRLVDVGSGHHVVPGALGPGRRFVDDLGHIGESGGESPLMFCEPGAVFQHAGHARPVKWPQVLPVTQRRDRRRVCLSGIFRAVDFHVELRLDLEELAEVFIQPIQELKDHGSPDEDDLHVEGNRLGAQCRGGH